MTPTQTNQTDAGKFTPTIVTMRADLQVSLRTASQVSTDSWLADRTVKSPSTGSGQPVLDHVAITEGEEDILHLSFSQVSATDMLATRDANSYIVSHRKHHCSWKLMV